MTTRNDRRVEQQTYQNRTCVVYYLIVILVNNFLSRAKRELIYSIQTNNKKQAHANKLIKIKIMQFSQKRRHYTCQLRIVCVCKAMDLLNLRQKVQLQVLVNVQALKLYKTHANKLTVRYIFNHHKLSRCCNGCFAKHQLVLHKLILGIKIKRREN